MLVRVFLCQAASASTTIRVYGIHSVDAKGKASCTE